MSEGTKRKEVEEVMRAALKCVSFFYISMSSFKGILIAEHKYTTAEQQVHAC